MVRLKFKSLLTLLSFGLLCLILEKSDIFIKKPNNRKFKTFFAPDLIDTWPYISNTQFLLLSDYIYVYDENTIKLDRIKNNEIILVQNNLINDFFSKFYSL